MAFPKAWKSPCSLGSATEMQAKKTNAFFISFPPGFGHSKPLRNVRAAFPALS